ISRLINQHHNNVAFYNQVFTLTENESNCEGIKLLDLDIWLALLKAGDKEKIIQRIEQYLAYLIDIEALNSIILKQIQQDLLQALYTYLNSEGIQAHQLYGDEHSLEYYEHATRSVKD